MSAPVAELLLSPWGAAYAGVGFLFALATAAFLYRKGGGDLVTRFCSTLIALYVWAAWPFMLALGIVVGLAYLLFSGTLLLLGGGWRRIRLWRYRLRYRAIPDRRPRPDGFLEPPREQPLEPSRREDS
jgi:hypothetical protein